MMLVTELQCFGVSTQQIGPRWIVVVSCKLGAPLPKALDFFTDAYFPSNRAATISLDKAARDLCGELK